MKILKVGRQINNRINIPQALLGKTLIRARLSSRETGNSATFPQNYKLNFRNVPIHTSENQEKTPMRRLIGRPGRVQAAQIRLIIRGISSGHGIYTDSGNQTDHPRSIFDRETVMRF
jgi:hypothetical protein